MCTRPSTQLSRQLTSQPPMPNSAQDTRSGSPMLNLRHKYVRNPLRPRDKLFTFVLVAQSSFASARGCSNPPAHMSSIAPTDWPTFRAALQSTHNSAHSTALRATRKVSSAPRMMDGAPDRADSSRQAEIDQAKSVLCRPRYKQWLTAAEVRSRCDLQRVQCLHEH